jgi:hypothetical protein
MFFLTYNNTAHVSYRFTVASCAQHCKAVPYVTFNAITHRFGLQRPVVGNQIGKVVEERISGVSQCEVALIACAVQPVRPHMVLLRERVGRRVRDEQLRHAETEPLVHGDEVRAADVCAGDIVQVVTERVAQLEHACIAKAVTKCADYYGEMAYILNVCKKKPTCT